MHIFRESLLQKGKGNHIHVYLRPQTVITPPSGISDLTQSLVTFGFLPPKDF